MHEFPERPTDPGYQIVRKFVIRGRRTSIRMERIFWQVMETISRKERKKINELISEIDDRREGGDLAAAVRVFAVSYFKSTCMPDETLDLDPDGDENVTIH
jgi:predicted DNA-binding ribbon-helix-helix protein